MTKVLPRTCLLEFENGTGPIHQKLSWNGQRYTLQGSLPGGPLRFRRLIVQTEAGHFEVLGSELEWHCGEREAETHRPDAVRSGPLYFTGEQQSVRLWVRVPTPLAPFTDKKRPGDYVVVLVVLGNLDTNHLEGSPLAVAAVDERAWDKSTETNYALCPLPTPNQSDIRVALPPRGYPSSAWGADSAFEQAFGARPDGGLAAIWRRTVGGDGATLYRLHLSRTFCSVPGSDDPSLAVGGRVAWEQVPNDDGDAAGVGGRWHLRPVRFDDRELLEWAQQRAWRSLLRTLFGRLETQRTFLFELLPTVGETGWLPAYDLLPDDGTSARRPFTFVERLPAWREPRQSRLRFPSVRDWTGEPLCAEATITAAVVTADGRRQTRFELQSVRIEPPARVRAGSLDLLLAGVVDEDSSCNFEFERTEDRRAAHSVRRLRLLGFEIGLGRTLLRLPVQSITPGGFDRDERRAERRERSPVLLVSPDAQLRNERVADLAVAEVCDVLGVRSLDLRLQARRTGASEPRSLRLLVLDPTPFTVGMVRMPDILTFQREDGTEIAYWTDRDLFAGWQMRAAAAGFDLVLPPQGVGEAMEKNRTGDGTPDVQPGQPVDFLFSPPAVLELEVGDLPRNYAATPWNLRLLLGESRPDRLTGLPLVAARFELLYGLTARLRGLPWLRVSELLARLGEPRDVLPESKVGADEVDLSVPREFRWRQTESPRFGDLGYSQVRKKWKKQLEAIAERLGVYEVHDDRQVEFTATGEPVGLQLTGQRGQVGLQYELRTSARFANPIADSGQATSGSPPPPLYSDGLAGGFAWAFESRLVWEALWAQRVGDAVPFVAGSLQRLFFSALGGSGTQQASFDEGRTILAARVELGRVVELRVERIGRLAVFWNRAKLVTVFTRSMVPSAQFGDRQDPLVGRAVLRKTEEYVEFVERKRTFPDAGAAPDQALLAGCVVACSCETRILVDARWGRDVRANGAEGWLVPLRVPFASPQVYGTVDVRLHLHADPTSGHGETTARIENATDLHFWSDTVAGRGSDSDRWPAVAGVDCGSFGSLDVEVGTEDLATPARIARAAPFTWRLVGLQQLVNLAGHLPPEGTEVAQLGARIESVTMARGSTRGVEPTRPKPTFADFRAACENGLAIVEQVVSNVPSEIASLGRQGWQKVRDLLDGPGGPLRRAKEVLDLIDGAPVSAALWQRLEEQLAGNVVGAVRRAKEASIEFVQRLASSQPFAAVGAVIGDRGPVDPEPLQRAVHAAADKLQSDWRRGVEAIDGLSGAAVRHLAAAIDACQSLRDALAGGGIQNVAQLRDLIERVRAAVLQIQGELDAIRWFGDLRLVARPLDLLQRKSLQELLDAIVTADPKRLRDLADGWRTDMELQLGLLVTALRERETSLLDAVGTVVDPLAELHGQLQQALADILLATDWNQQKERFDAARTLLQSADRQFLIEAFSALASELGTAVRGLAGSWLGGARAMRDSLVAIGREWRQGLIEQLPDLSSVEGRVEAWTDWLRRRREGIASLSRAVPGTLQSALSADLPSLQVPQQALSLLRAFGDVPRAAGLDFQRIVPADALKASLDQTLQAIGQRLRSIGYAFDAAARRVDFTPVMAAVDRARNAVGDLVEEARLKAASLQMPVRAFQQRLLGDAETLARSALGNLMPDLGGLRLERLLGGVVGDELAARIGAATKVRHSFDRQTMTASVEARIDELALGRDARLFGLGPVAFTLRRPRLQARLGISARPGEPVRRQASGRITADWEMAVGGRPLLTFRSATLRCDDGQIRMEIDPARLELDGLLRSLSDLMRSVRTGDDNFGAGIDTDLPNRVVGYCRLRMGLPPLQAGAFAITNLSFGAFMEVGVDLQGSNGDGERSPRFLVRTGCNVASREAPFAIVVFVLGGCGWFRLSSSYTVPLAAGSGEASELVVELDAGIGVAASIGLNLGFASGSVFASLSLEVRCTVARGRSSWGMGVVLTFGGRVRVLGIIDVSLLVVLAVRYETGGGLTGEGRISISIRICWFLKIKVEAGFTYRFGRAAGSSAPPREAAARLAPASAARALPLSGTPALAASSLRGTPEVVELPRPDRRHHLRRAAAMNA